MAKLSEHRMLLMAGLALCLFLVVGGLVVDAGIETSRYRRSADVQASLLRMQAAEIDQLIGLRRPEKRPIEPYREELQQRLRLLQSQTRILGVDARFEVWPADESGGSIQAAQTVRQKISLHQLGMVGHVDVRHPEAPGWLASTGDNLAVMMLLLTNLLVPLFIGAYLFSRSHATDNPVAPTPAGLDELVHKLIDAGKASNDAGLLKLLDEHAALVSEIRQSAEGLESNTQHLRETRLGLSRPPTSARA